MIDPISIALLAAAGAFLVGIALTWLLLIHRFRLAKASFQLEMQSENNALQAKLEAQTGALARALDEADHLNGEVRELHDINRTQHATIARLETQLAAERKQHSEKLTLLQDARAQLVAEFENLSNKVLDEKSRKFTDQNKHNIDQVLSPLRDQLKDFRSKVEEVYDKESRDRVSLYHEIHHLKTLNQQISNDAVNLTHALKGQSQVQGAWGELILERILEQSGLEEGREYTIQGSVVAGDGKRLRPDVIVHMPDDKSVVVDAKVSLTAYERYVSAETDEQRVAALKDHIASVRAHIGGLSSKRYEDLPGITSLDFVLMFIPIESAFITVVEHDWQIVRDAFDKNVMLVSPVTLLASLRTIHNLWRHEDRNRNAMLIADSAGKLYDQFVLFIESLENVGDRLDKAQTAYQEAHKRLVSGRGNLVNRVEKIKTLGAKAKKQLDKNLKLEAMEEDAPQDSP